MTGKSIKELIEIIEYCIEKDKTKDLQEALEILHDALEELEYESEFDDNE